MKRADDEKLWDLLGRAVEPKVSPFFSRNVLREIRQHGPGTSLRGWFGLRRLVPAAAGVAVALIALVFLRMPAPVPSASQSQSDEMAIVSAQDYEVMADLDDLLASDDSNSWDDSVAL